MKSNPRSGTFSLTQFQIHFLTKFRQDQTVSEMLQPIKGKSSKWINEQNELKRKFHWQSEYSAFTVSESQAEAVISYSRNQEEHHRHITFEEEYEEFLQKMVLIMMLDIYERRNLNRLHPLRGLEEERETFPGAKATRLYGYTPYGVFMTLIVFPGYTARGHYFGFWSRAGLPAKTTALADFILRSSTTMNSQFMTFCGLCLVSLNVISPMHFFGESLFQTHLIEKFANFC